MEPQHSSIEFFRKAMAERQRMLLTGQGSRQGSSLSMLELSVISCFGVVQETAIHMAEAAVKEGIGQVEEYLPLMHETLAPLHNFLIALTIAPSYGAWTWPNAELRAVADSLAELGIHMKYHQKTTAGGSNSSNGRVAFPSQSSHFSQLPAVGAVVGQQAVWMRKFASKAYFFSEDLTFASREGWRRLNHAEDIFGELFVQAISARALGMAYTPQHDELVSLILCYRAVNAHNARQKADM